MNNRKQGLGFLHSKDLDSATVSYSTPKTIK